MNACRHSYVFQNTQAFRQAFVGGDTQQKSAIHMQPHSFQTAIEVVKAVLPDLYNFAENSNSNISVVIADLAKGYEEIPSPKPAGSVVFDFVGSQSKSDIIGNINYNFISPNLEINASIDVSGELAVKYFKTSGVVNPTTGEVDYRKDEIDEAEANTLIHISTNIVIKLDDGIVTNKTLGETLSHELGHFKYLSTNPAKAKAEKNGSVQICA